MWGGPSDERLYQYFLYEMLSAMKYWDESFVIGYGFCKDCVVYTVLGGNLFSGYVNVYRINHAYSLYDLYDLA